MSHVPIDPALEEWSGRQRFFFNAFKALSFNAISGDYAEFGCCGGMTFALAFQEIVRSGGARKLWAFDSFEGFPAPSDSKDAHPRWTAGAMEMSVESFEASCRAAGLAADQYEVVKGFYHTTLAPTFDGPRPSTVALAYIDCDLFSSTQSVLRFLMPILKHGMIIAFDDYFCWSETTLSGERKAMLECFRECKSWNLLPYAQFGWHGQAFIVEAALLLAE